MTGKPTPPKADGREHWRFHDVEAVYWAMEAKGYRGADALRALPDVMGVLHAVANSPSSSEVALARATARSLVQRLTKKGDTDDAA